MRINLSFLYRKKKYDASSVETTNLHRVLNLSDLSALGIASTLGPGVYVLIGNIIAKYTGPSIVLSFLIAGVCSFLAGLCYAELGSRVPRSGSAYIYIYVTIGEFLAFFIGWNVILEYIIGTSAGASALSQYIDALSDFQISKAMRAAMPMNLPGIAPYPDFLAFGMLLIIIFMLILGVKDSSMLNIIFTGANLAIVVFIVIVGTIESDPGNWFLDVYPNMSYTDMMGQNTTCAISNRCGSGGFTPFGAEGVIKGAAKCFYAYIGFDVIATSGEEVLDPKRTIPLSIVTTLIVVSLCYVLVSTTVSLMLPYYVYDPSSPLSEAFRYVGFQWASYVISVGAIISLATSLYAAMFPMPRVVYAMASDGLLFRQLDYVTPLFKTPLFACILTGLLSALLVLIFDLNQLVDMMSFGTLLAYSLVSVCTLILRYRPHEDYSHTVTVSQNGNGVATTETASNGSSETQQETQQEVVKKTWIGSIFGHSNEPLWKRIFMPTSIKPTKATSKLVNALTFIEVIDILVICAITNLGNLGYATAFAFFIIFLIIFVIIAFLIWLQPTDDKITTFKVPLVPFFPLCSAFINTFLMTSLNSATWIRFLVWFAIGFFVYFGYGIRYSHENKQGPHQNWLCPCFEKSYTTMEDTESVIPNSTIINDNESTV